MKRFKSLGSLIDDRREDNGDKSSGKENWRRLFKRFSFSRKDDYALDSQKYQKQQKLSRFTSHVNLFENPNQLSRIEEDTIQNFIEDELIFVQNLSKFKETLSYVCLKDKLKLEENVRIFINYNTEKFLPALQEATNFNEFINAFRENLNLYEIYKNLLVSCMTALMQFTVDNDFEEVKNDLISGLNLSNKRLNDQINSLNNISTCCSQVDIKNKITILVAIIKTTLATKVEDIRLILYEIVKFKKDHISKCKYFVNEIIPKIMSDIKYSHKSHLIIGNVPDILNEELKLYELIKSNFDFDQPNKLVQDFLQYEGIFELYKEDTVIDTTLKRAFCNDHRIDSKYFSLIIDQLFHMKNLFERLCYYLQKSGKNSTDVEMLIELINASLHHLDNSMAVGQICGSSIDMEKYGKVILRSKFRVRCKDKPSYEGMVFLFDSGVVFTKEENLTDLLCGYVFENVIPIDKLAFIDDDDHCLKLYKQEKSKKSEFHELFSTEYSTIFKWKMTLKEILMKQLQQRKEEAHRRRKVAKSVIF